VYYTNVQLQYRTIVQAVNKKFKEFSNFFLKLTVLCCHSEAKPKNPAFEKDNCIIRTLRFFASIRSAQNDKLRYVAVNKTLTTITATE